jgi:hypothetical protein
MAIASCRTQFGAWVVVEWSPVGTSGQIEILPYGSFVTIPNVVVVANVPKDVGLDISEDASGVLWLLWKDEATDTVHRLKSANQGVSWVEVDA